MAITGISAIGNQQIIAAGAQSAISAQQALQTSGGNNLQGLYDFVSNNSGSWGGGSFPASAAEACDVVTGNSANWNSTESTVYANSANWGDIPTKVVATSADATGSNILYIVTGS